MLFEKMLSSPQNQRIRVEYGGTVHNEGSSSISVTTSEGINHKDGEGFSFLIITESYDSDSVRMATDVGGTYYYSPSVDGVIPSETYYIDDNSHEEHMSISLAHVPVFDGDYSKSAFAQFRNVFNTLNTIVSEFAMTFLRVMGRKSISIAKQEEFYDTTLFPISITTTEVKKNDLILAIMNIRHADSLDSLSVTSSTHEVSLVYSDNVITAYPRYKIYAIEVDDNNQVSFQFNAPNAYQQATAMYVILRGA